MGSWHLVGWRLDPTLTISYVYTSTFFALVLKVKFSLLSLVWTGIRNCRTHHHTYSASLTTSNPWHFPVSHLWSGPATKLLSLTSLCMPSTAQNSVLFTKEKLGSLAFLISLINHCGFQCTYTSAYEKPQFTQIYIFVAIPCPSKESKNLQGCKNGLMSQILKALTRQEEDFWIEHFLHSLFSKLQYIFIHM